jgi:hypothetical protein
MMESPEHPASFCLDMIGLGILFLCVCHGCSRCESQRIEDRVIESIQEKIKNDLPRSSPAA